MTYMVKFRDDALKEWLKLDKTIQRQFAKKLKKCSDNPHIPSAKLRGLSTPRFLTVICHFHAR